MSSAYRLVREWAHGYNTFLDAGFPYARSRFISPPGTCYAMMATTAAAEPSK